MGVISGNDTTLHALKQSWYSSCVAHSAQRFQNISTKEPPMGCFRSPDPPEDRSIWPPIRLLELNWIVCKIRKKDKLSRESLMQRIRSGSPAIAVASIVETYMLFANEARLFNKIVFNADADWPTSIETGWPFKYWSCIRLSSRSMENRDFHLDFLRVPQEQFAHMDRMCRHHRIATPDYILHG
jgi:hypothetical protein